MSNRKEDHINLALMSETLATMVDKRFNYNPLLGVHPSSKDLWPIDFLGFQMNYPIWVSSMTGGTPSARDINQRLARLCNEYKLGMGLGSCRKLIEDPDSVGDFQIRKFIGRQPLFANLGVAQCTQWLDNSKAFYIDEIMKITEADGLILHINPFQEWMQHEGDRYHEPALTTIKRMLDKFSFPIIAKEVGQGFSKEALGELMKLNLAAIEFGAFGGTNFANLEKLRNIDERKNDFEPFIYVGHTAEEMVQYTNEISDLTNGVLCKNLIISGGVKNFLDAYYLLSLSSCRSIIGMASAWLTKAQVSYDVLEDYFNRQMSGLLMAKNFLTVKNNYREV